jgi:hypothetical protein
MRHSHYFGITGLFLLLPLLVGESIFAVQIEEGIISTQNNEKTYGFLTPLQSFVPDTTPPYVKITSPNHCSTDIIQGTVVVRGVASDSDRVKMVEAFAHTLPLEGEILF